MANQLRINVLKLGGVFFEEAAQTGGSAFSKSRGTVAFTVMMTWCRQNVSNFVLCL